MNAHPRPAWSVYLRLRRLALATSAGCRVAVLAVLCTSTVGGEEWPRWRGPRGDGTWDGPILPSVWPKEGLPHAWKSPLAGGYSGVVVADGRAFTMDRPKSEDEQERVVCLDAGTGKQLWQFTYAALYKDLDYGSGPRASPTVHGGRVYTLGAVGTALCLDAATGKCLWQRNLTEGLNAAIPTWCLAASPVIWKDLVILHCGARPDGSFVAVDAVTGREIWRACPDPAGYCTPILANAAGMTQLIGWTPENVVGLDPDRGSLLWQVPYKVTYGVSIATPIFQDGHALVTGYWEGTKAVRLGPKPTDANLEWENLTEIQGLMSQPLYRQGLVYCLDRDRGLTCFEMTTGKIRWYDRHKMTPAGRNPHASMIWIGHEDRALILNAEGYLILARFTPDGYVELSRTRICGPTWAHPAFAGNRVYARTDEELICVEMTGS